MCGGGFQWPCHRDDSTGRDTAAHCQRQLELKLGGSAGPGPDFGSGTVDSEDAGAPIPIRKPQPGAVVEGEPAGASGAVTGSVPDDDSDDGRRPTWKKPLKLAGAREGPASRCLQPEV